MYGDSNSDMTEIEFSDSDLSLLSNVQSSLDNSSVTDYDVPLSFFDKLYFSKNDIKVAVQKYHSDSRRSFQILKSDQRRYYIRCSVSNCPFKLNFNFRNNNWSNPKTRVPHTCNPSFEENISVSSLVNDEDVRNWFSVTGRNADMKGLRSLLATKGISAANHTMARCIKRLKEVTFVDDILQYQYLSSYVEKMNSKGHFCVMEKTLNDNFIRLSLIYNEGLECFRYYFQRGLQLDGTFLKNNYGGVLLVGCFKDGNNNIRILGIAVVPNENEDHWSWFLQNIKSHLQTPPSFVISDRDKGLKKAVENFGVFHAYCFRHVLENFHKLFKNKNIKEKAWALAKAKSPVEFNSIKDYIVGVNPEAFTWFETIGLEKITLLFSPICRYGTITSNNVESVNSRLREARKLPIMDLLLYIEELVTLDRFHAVKRAEKWNGQLTKYSMVYN